MILTLKHKCLLASHVTITETSTPIPNMEGINFQMTENKIYCSVLTHTTLNSFLNNLTK